MCCSFSTDPVLHSDVSDVNEGRVYTAVLASGSCRCPRLKGYYNISMLNEQFEWFKYYCGLSLAC